MSSLQDNPWTDETSAPGPTKSGSSLFPLSSPTISGSNNKKKPSSPESPLHTEDSTSNRGIIPVHTENQPKKIVPELTSENMAENDRAFCDLFFGPPDPQSEGQKLNKQGKLETDEERYKRRLEERSDRERERDQFFRQLDDQSRRFGTPFS